jgi:hypothetical protein
MIWTESKLYDFLGRNPTSSELAKANCSDPTHVGDCGTCAGCGQPRFICGHSRDYVVIRENAFPGLDAKLWVPKNKVFKKVKLQLGAEQPVPDVVPQFLKFIDAPAEKEESPNIDIPPLDYPFDFLLLQADVVGRQSIRWSIQICLPGGIKLVIVLRERFGDALEAGDPAEVNARLLWPLELSNFDVSEEHCAQLDLLRKHLERRIHSAYDQVETQFKASDIEEIRQTGRIFWSTYWEGKMTAFRVAIAALNEPPKFEDALGKCDLI